MSESSVTLRALLDELAQQDRAPRDAARHMHEAISSSPFLTHFITNAVDKGLVKHIRFSPAETNSSGHFEATEKTIYINRQNFDLFLQGDMSAEQLHDRMVSTLAHETSHAFSAYSLLAAQSTLDYQIITEIQSGGFWWASRADGTCQGLPRCRESTRGRGCACWLECTVEPGRCARQETIGC